MTRRELLAAIPAGAFMLQQDLSAQSNSQKRLLLGTSKRGSKGIYVAHLTDGHLTTPTLAVEASNPSFLALAATDAPVLFAVTQPENVVSHASSFTHPHTGEQLQPISHAGSQATGGCHCGVTRDGRTVLIANYGGASAASFQADTEGKLTLASHIAFPPDEHGPNPDRQTQSYIHSTLAAPGDRFALANDLGLDRIHIFGIDPDTSKLTPHGNWHAAPGSGPRHLVFHPNGRWIYCIHELNSTVAQLEWNATEGTLKTLGTPVSTLAPGVSPEGKRACELAFAHDHRYLYASNRVDESFTVYTVDTKTGALAPIQHLQNPGKESRHIAVSPDGKTFLSANQFSDEISLFPIDTATGKLGDRTQSVPLGGPSCLLFA